MIITSVKKLQCEHCGLNINLRVCSIENSEQIILCIDCLIDSQEDYYETEDGEI